MSDADPFILAAALEAVLPEWCKQPQVYLVWQVGYLACCAFVGIGGRLWLSLPVAETHLLVATSLFYNVPQTLTHSDVNLTSETLDVFLEKCPTDKVREIWDYAQAQNIAGSIKSFTVLFYRLEDVRTPFFLAHQHLCSLCACVRTCVAVYTWMRALT